MSPYLRGRCSARNLFCTVIALLLFGLSLACNQTPRGGAKSTVNPLDRIDAVRVKPINFLHKTFTVKKYAQFLVEVPPHTVIPRIHGTFQSFVPQTGDDNLSDDSTDVSFLLMKPAQLAEYARGNGGGTALYTVEPTHDHEVEFVLPPTNDATREILRGLRQRARRTPRQIRNRRLQPLLRVLTQPLSFFKGLSCR